MERLAGFGVRWKRECAVELPSQQVEVTIRKSIMDYDYTLPECSLVLLVRLNSLMNSDQSFYR